MRNAARRFGRPVDVLDLACGDGYLTQLCLDQLGDEIRTITGVDMSEVELDAARSRLRGTRARLELGLAQSLSLDDASVDVVLCHAAFMLMLPVEPVVAELARILRPGGVFSGVVGSTSKAPASRAGSPELRREHALWEELRTATGGFWSTEFPQLQTDGRLGDGRALTAEGWGRLFDVEAGFTGEVDVEEFEVVVAEPADGIWAFFKLTYLAEMLDEPRRDALRARVLNVIGGHEPGPDGLFAMTFPLRRLTVRRR